MGCAPQRHPDARQRRAAQGGRRAPRPRRRHAVRLTRAPSSRRPRSARASARRPAARRARWCEDAERRAPGKSGRGLLGASSVLQVSVFAAPDDDLAAVSAAVRAIRIRPVVRVARCGALRAAGFEMVPTFPNPWHFSVVLPDATPSTFGALRDCFGSLVPNPGHIPDE